MEDKFRQCKNRHALAEIRARLDDTSASWILAIFLVKNLTLPVRFFFARNGPLAFSNREQRFHFGGCTG
ncbi:hypothetical protein SIID45300_02673 [Candidatus Magnetaquicoccaceae bacterium FCR-1]|uniref:Transposase n=1 Tax=Candidatus Magnetaquiglobus chichijimensis TaxID=3141448 RepID=A0ABQ0CCA8_9PROT